MSEARCVRDLAFLQRISGIVYPAETVIYLTSKDWAGIAKEVKKLGYKTDQRGMNPTPKNFKRLKIGTLTAFNSGTDDQAVCDALNAPEEVKSHFRAKHDRFAIPASEKKVIEAVDAESTHEFPEGLRQEVEEKLRKKYNTIDLEVVR